MFIVSVIQKNGDKAYFKQCGVGFENRDGSINFKLDLLGDVQLHLAKKRENESGPREVPNDKRAS
jgi:hypothetical protein